MMVKKEKKLSLPRREFERGVALIVVILVLSFLLTIGVVLLTVTGTGPQVAANVRSQSQAFNAAEAGFNRAWKQLNDNIANGVMADFSSSYRTTFNHQPGLDDPQSNVYFRKLSDQQLVEDVLDNTDNYIYASEPFQDDNRFAYTVFLINDEGGGGIQDDMDGILVCIGRGLMETYSRLEILIEIQSEY